DRYDSRPLHDALPISEPRTRKPWKPCTPRKRAACVGMSAAKTAGCVAIHGAPAAAMLTNHMSVAGPNTAPTSLVPRRWTRKSPRSEEHTSELQSPYDL